jgi:hypothetical protein
LKLQHFLLIQHDARVLWRQNVKYLRHLSLAFLEMIAQVMWFRRPRSLVSSVTQLPLFQIEYLGRIFLKKIENCTEMFPFFSSIDCTPIWTILSKSRSASSSQNGPINHRRAPRIAHFKIQYLGCLCLNLLQNFTSVFSSFSSIECTPIQANSDQHRSSSSSESDHPEWRFSQCLPLYG